MVELVGNNKRLDSVDQRAVARERLGNLVAVEDRALECRLVETERLDQVPERSVLARNGLRCLLVELEAVAVVVPAGN